MTIVVENVAINNKFMKNIDRYILGQRQKVTTKQNERKFLFTN